MHNASLLVVVVCFCVVTSSAQPASTVRDGDWSDSTIWSGQRVPDATFDIITVQHNVRVPSSYTSVNPLSVDQLTISSGGYLIVDAGACVTIANGPGTDLVFSASSATSGLEVEGRLLARDGTASIDGPTTLVNNGSLTLNSITVSANGLLQSSGLPVDVTGMLTVSGGGSFTSNSGLTLFGNLSVTGSLLANGQVIFADTTKMTGTGSKVFGDVLVTGVLTPNSIYTLTGDLVVADSGVVNAGTSTVTFNGNSSLRTIGTGTVTFNNITIADGKTLNAYSDFAIAGATMTWNGMLVSTATTTFSRTGITTLRGTGASSFAAIIVAPGTTLTPDMPYAIAGNLTVNGLLRAGNSTTSFFGSSILMTSNPTPSISFNNIMIGPADSLTSIPENVTVNGNFTNNGFFNANRGTVTFAGNTTKSISGTSVTQFNSITINNGTAPVDVSVDNDAALTGILTLTGSAHLDADGAADTSTFTLLSSGDNPAIDASIAALPSGAVIQGNITVQRYLSIEGAAGRTYRYISPSVSNAPVSDLQRNIPVTGNFAGSSLCAGCSTNPSLFWYDETAGGNINDGYRSFPEASNSETLVPGRGYAVFVRGNVDPIADAGSARYQLRGPVNAGTIPYNLTLTPSGIAANDGWNLIGNPYPSAIDWNAKGWTKTNIGASIYLLDNVAQGRYAVWNGSVGVNGGTRYIAAGQGYFIKASGPAPVLTSGENVKVAGAQTRYFRDELIPNILRIALVQGPARDETVLQFRDSVTTSFDFDFDAVKLKNMRNDGSSIPFFNVSTRSPGDNQNLAINVMPSGACATAVAMDLADLSPGLYELDFSEIESFAPDVALLLTDKFVRPNLTVDLRKQASYSFAITADSRSQGADRFVVLFSNVSMPTHFSIDKKNSCEGQPTAIYVDSTRAGFVYSVLVNGTQVGEGRDGYGGGLEFAVSPSLLVRGRNVFEVLGVSATCGTAMYRQADSLLVIPSPSPPDVLSATVCSTGSVTLTADGAPVGGHYRWYGEPGAGTVLADSSDSFVTPVLSKTKIYGVSVVDGTGCESSRTEVAARIVQPDTAAITVVDAMTLRSNFDTGNRWSRDSELLADTTKILKINSSGLYRLTVTIAECTSSAEKRMVVTGFPTTAGLHVFPNPATNMVFIEIKDERTEVMDCRVFDESGKLIDVVPINRLPEHATGTFDASHYPAGVYFVTLRQANKTISAKIIKQ